MPACRSAPRRAWHPIAPHPPTPSPAKGEKGRLGGGRDARPTRKPASALASDGGPAGEERRERLAVGGLCAAVHVAHGEASARDVCLVDIRAVQKPVMQEN